MTIVNRRTFLAEHGKFEEALALLREMGKGTPHPYRLYHSYYGIFDTIALETEFGSVAEMETFWSAADTAPGMDEYMTRWYALTRSGGTNEVWILTDRN